MRIKAVTYTRLVAPGITEDVSRFSIVGKLRSGPRHKEMTLASLGENFSLPKVLWGPFIRVIQEGKPCSRLYPGVDDGMADKIDAIAMDVRKQLGTKKVHGVVPDEPGQPPKLVPTRMSMTLSDMLKRPLRRSEPWVMPRKALKRTPQMAAKMAMVTSEMASEMAAKAAAIIAAMMAERPVPKMPAKKLPLRAASWMAVEWLMMALKMPPWMPRKKAAKMQLRMPRKMALKMQPWMAKKPEDIPLRSGDIHILAGKSFGPEKLILDAMREIGLEDMRVNAGANPWYAKMNVGAIVARMCGRTSDRASRRWLMSDSSLGLLMGIDFKDTSEMSLRRASDALVASKESLDEQLRAGFSPSVREAGGEQKGKGRIFRIDCTNVHYEGQAKGNSLASRGHSKAKRFDCKLVSIAIAINEDGFIEIAHFLPGNVSEPSILSDMLDGLGVRAGDTVMMDAGIFTEANRKLLESRGILYVAPHSGLRENFNFRMADRVEMPDGNVVRAYRVADPSGTFMEIIGHSTERQKSDIEYTQTRCNRFKAEADSISKKLGDSGTRKDIRYIHERIGRLRQKYGVGKHFKIVVVPSDSDASQAASIICTRVEVAGSKADCPGVYRFRTNNLSLNAQEVVELYRTLVEIEAVFRCLKSELGTRPIYHWTADRANGHIYIACLACQIVNHIRLKLKKKGINYSWTTVKDLLDDCRLGAVLGVSSDGKDDVLIIQSTPPTKKVKTVYRAMGPGYGARIHLILLAPHRKKRGAPHRGRDGPTWAELKRFRVRCVE